MRRDQMLFQQCGRCPNGDFCARYGCTTWNDDARAKYERMKRRAAESNREIDELERLLARLNRNDRSSIP